MTDVWFSVLIISLITAFGGLAALLVQSYSGEALHHAKEYLLPWYRGGHRRAQITSILHKGRRQPIPTSAATEDASAAWRELLKRIKKRCSLVPNPGERLRIRVLDDDAICRPRKIFKEDIFIDSVCAVQERRKR